MLDALVRGLAIDVKFVSVVLKLLMPEQTSFNYQKSSYLNIYSFNIVKLPGFSLQTTRQSVFFSSLSLNSFIPRFFRSPNSVLQRFNKT